MKIKEGFMLREVAGNYIVVAVGQASKEFKGLINLNSVGAFLFKALKEETTEEDVINKLLDEYEIDRETATKDVRKFIEQLRGGHILE